MPHRAAAFLGGNMPPAPASAEVQALRIRRTSGAAFAEHRERIQATEQGEGYQPARLVASWTKADELGSRTAIDGRALSRADV